MFLLLNRFAFFLSLAIALIPLAFGWVFFPLSVIVFLIMRFSFLSSEVIHRAIDEYVISEKIWEKPYTPMSNDDPLIQKNIVSHNTVIHSESTNSSRSDNENILTETIVPESAQPSRFSLWFHAFFADRPLAKVGGILLFLGALFFLYLIFDAVGPVGKIIIGITFGFFLIWIGLYLDKKSIEIESRVLIGIGIAVNYLTILSGRHLLSGGLIATEPLFSDIFTTFALLLNTGLTVLLALTYRSWVLLSFAFVFAYLTPMLVGSDESSIFLLTAYVTLITIAASIIISLYQKNTSQDASILHGIATIGMTFLFGFASMSISTTPEYSTLFFWVCVSGFALVFSMFDNHKNITTVFAWMYIVVLMSLFSDSLVLLPIFIVIIFAGAIWAFFSWILSIIAMATLWVSSFFFGLFAFWIVGPSFFIPLLVLSFFVFVLLGLVFVRSNSILIGIVSVIGYGLILLLWLWTIGIQDILTPEAVFLSKISACFLLLAASIISILKQDARLYLLAIVVSGILLIFPDTYYNYFWISLFSAILYTLISLVVPYIFLVRGNTISQTSLLATLPITNIVIVYSIYQVFSEKFPGLILGWMYVLQALVTLIYATMLYQHFARIESTFTQLTKNILLILFAVPVSLFTFALVFLFWDIPSIMSLAWVIEASILYLIAVRMHDSRIFAAAHIILFLGLTKEMTLIDSFFTWDWMSFWIILIMGTAIMSSLMILKDETSSSRRIYDALHIIAIIILWFGISEIVPSTSTGWNLLSMSIFVLLLSPIYRLYGSIWQHISLTIMYGIICVYFIGDFDYLKKHEFLPLIVQSGSLIILMLAGMLGARGIPLHSPIRVTVSVISGLILSSFYIDEFFGTFAVSLYLAIIATICIIFGIQKLDPRYRTIWLYIGISVLLKILFYDIWYTSGDLIFRVVALMVTGWLMIYLSQLYGKHVSRVWSEELDVSNIFPQSLMESIIASDDTPWEGVSPFDSILDTELQSTEITGITAVKFIHTSGADFILRRVWVIRIARYIATRMNKEIFAPNELSSIFAGVMPHLQSTMPEKDIQSLLTKIELWVHEGGRIEFIYKK